MCQSISLQEKSHLTNSTPTSDYFSSREEEDIAEFSCLYPLVKNLLLTLPNSFWEQKLLFSYPKNLHTEDKNHV